MQKTIHNINLYDLMAEDWSVWLKKRSDFGYDLYLEDEEGIEITENSMHPYAIDSMASFCKHFLKLYERENKKII